MRTEISETMEWLSCRNKAVAVDVEPVPWVDLRGWNFDPLTGNLVHDSGRFFSVVGIDVRTNAGTVSHWRQPIINQPEVGILGIIRKNFGGETRYLMQAKIEPGNVNCVQLSPTVQATRSNYLQVHGGKCPAYLEYCQNVLPRQVVLDQLQSEQGGRFLRKRNRNIIIQVEEDIPERDDFCWLTLAQIKQLMRHDNVVNMDARTVLSGLKGEGDIPGKPLLSIDDILHRLSLLKSRYELITEKIPLKEVSDWMVSDFEIARKDKLFFKVMGVRVAIANREVSHWFQPIVQPMHEGICVLFCKRIAGVMHYLLQAKVECGNFDVVELAPTIQCLTGPYKKPIGYTPKFLKSFLGGELRGRVVVDVMQSEEGGRFYHEQNRNVVYELEDDVDVDIGDDRYMWITMPQLKEFLRFNNYLNIQVRSLISLL